MNKVKRARLLQGISQEEIARRAGGTRQTIGLIKSGSDNPTLNLCINIAKALYATLDKLFRETVRKRPTTPKQAAGTAFCRCGASGLRMQARQDQ